MKGIPSLSAASALAWKPPASPESLVTTQSTPQADQSARLKTVENGPCIAQMWDRGIPALIASSKDALSGVISKNNSQCYEWDSVTRATSAWVTTSPVVLHSPTRA